MKLTRFALPVTRLFLFALTSMLCLTHARADTTRATLLEVIGGVPHTPERVLGWQPLVAEFGPKVFSEWERGLFEGAIGNHEQARQWFIKAANKGNTPEKQTLCLAYKLARGTTPQDRDNPIGEGQKARAAEQKMIDWYRNAYAKKAKKQKLTPEEKAAWYGIESLPDDEEESRKVSLQRLVLCRNLTDSPSPEKIFRAALAAGRPLPAYALNELAAKDESEGKMDEAERLYQQSFAAGFAPAGTNLVRLKERKTQPAPGDRAWESILVGYRQQAELGDGRAMIYLADLMERGSSGPANPDVAIMLYRQGIDAGKNESVFNEGMGYVFLGLHAQERLTEYFKAGRLKLESEAERKKYLSLGYLLQEWAGEKKKDAMPQETRH